MAMLQHENGDSGVHDIIPGKLLLDQDLSLGHRETADFNRPQKRVFDKPNLINAIDLRSRGIAKNLDLNDILRTDHVGENGALVGGCGGRRTFRRKGWSLGEKTRNIKNKKKGRANGSS